MKHYTECESVGDFTAAYLADGGSATALAQALATAADRGFSGEYQLGYVIARAQRIDEETRAERARLTAFMKRPECRGREATALRLLISLDDADLAAAVLKDGGARSWKSVV